MSRRQDSEVFRTRSASSFLWWGRFWVIVQGQRAHVPVVEKGATMSSGYNEPNVTDGVRHLHRALASLQEELEAVDYYQQRADQSTEEALKAILLHNRDEEIEHAVMLLEWLRRSVPAFDSAIRTYLFTTKPVTEIEAAAAGVVGGEDLGLGPLK